MSELDPIPAPADPELDAAAFPGGLSRREIGTARDWWQAHVPLRGGLGFDSLDGLLTLISLLPHPPAPKVWTGLALGPELAAASSSEREQAVAWLYRLGTHIGRRVTIDPRTHGDAVLPEFDFLPRDERESEEDAERRTARAWSAGAAQAMRLDPHGADDMIRDHALRKHLAPIVLLGQESFDDGESITRRARLRLMAEAALGAHRLWQHYQPIRERGGLRRTPQRSQPRPGRNEPCPCGSGRKFKVCHGAAVH